MKVARVIDGNSDTQTAQAFFFKLNSDSAQIILSFIIEADGVEAFATVRQLGLNLDDLFENLLGSNVTKLKEINRFIAEKLASLESYSVLTSLCDQTNLSITRTGGAEAILLRDGKPIKLTLNLQNDKVISGPIKPGDKFLLINSIIADSTEFIDEVFETGFSDLDDTVENFLQSDKLAGPIALVLLDNEDGESIHEKPSTPFQLTNKPKINLAVLLKIKYLLPSFPQIKSWAWKLRKNPRALIIGLVFLIIFIFGLRFGVIYLKNKWQKSADFKQYYQIASNDYTQAVAAKDSDKDKALGLLSAAASELKLASSLEPNNKSVQDLTNKISDQNDDISKIYHVKNWTTFLALNLIKTNFGATRFSDSKGQMLVLDPTQKSLVSLDQSSKTPQILAGQYQLGDTQSADVDGTAAYVFSPDKGVFKVSLLADTPVNQKVTPIVPPDPDWGKIKDIFAFGENVYLLDSVKNQIWKYQATDIGYSAKLGYVQTDQPYDFLQASVLRIDGSVWVLKPGNVLLKFTGGLPDFYEESGVNPEIKELVNFYTSDQTDNIYLLDNANSRVVVTDKNGKYVSQYLGDKFKDATDLIIDEKGKILYLLENSTIYETELH